jgi:hypothetical protein
MGDNSVFSLLIPQTGTRTINVTIMLVSDPANLIYRSVFVPCDVRHIVCTLWECCFNDTLIKKG